MFQLGVVVVAADDGDDVESHLIYNAFGLDIVVGCKAYAAYLLYVYSIIGLCHYVVGPGLYLHEHHRCAVVCACNDVNVAVAYAPVAFNNVVT